MIRIITVGNIKKKEIGLLVDYYMKQMKRVSLEVVKDEEKFFSRITDAFVVVCSEDGKEMDSISFSSLLEKNMDRPMVFLVGGAFGLRDGVKKKADLVLSMSQFTFPHEIALLLLVEQVYRALQIHKGSPYHKLVRVFCFLIDSRNPYLCVELCQFNIFAPRADIYVAKYRYA
jgi:23S rRNA (pseudouridine1915-N3)-methyltransferase